MEGNKEKGKNYGVDQTKRQIRSLNYKVRHLGNSDSFNHHAGVHFDPASESQAIDSKSAAKPPRGKMIDGKS